MAAILRITSSYGGLQDDSGGRPGRPDAFKGYVDRMVKLIPAEVVSVYLAGKAGIQATFPPGGGARTSGFISENAYWAGWTIFCLVAVIVVRAWATSDRPANIPPQWPAVLIAATSFVIWVYSLGDVFARHGIWEPLLSSMIVLGWTLLVPLFYRGEPGG